MQSAEVAGVVLKFHFVVLGWVLLMLNHLRWHLKHFVGRLPVLQPGAGRALGTQHVYDASDPAVTLCASASFILLPKLKLAQGQTSFSRGKKIACLQLWSLFAQHPVRGVIVLPRHGDVAMMVEVY